MKRLALLSVVALMLVAVFAPVAMAQAPGEIDVQQVTLGPGESVTVSGTIQCLEGSDYAVHLTVRQRTSGNLYNTTDDSVYGQCDKTTGPTLFTVTTFGEGPFHRGPASVSFDSYVCDSNYTCYFDQGVEDVRIR